MIGEKHGIQCMPCFSQIISEMLPENHTMEKCDFIKCIICSQIINSLLSTIAMKSGP